MKSLVTALSALPLSLVLSSLSPAQEATDLHAATQPQLPGKLAQTTPAPPSQSPPLPVAEAKKRYRETHERLQNLVKGGNLPSARWKKERSFKEAKAMLEIEANEQPRDRLGTAVAEEFDARRQLQQAELTELEDRIARIKRAPSIRDAMRDTIIDQRTDELLDQLEEGGKTGQCDGSPAPSGGRPGGHPSAAGGTAAQPDNAAPAESDADAVLREARLLKLDIDEAKANLESAGRARDRALRLYKSGAISKEAFDEEDQKWKVAKIQLDRLVVKMDAFLEAHRSDLPATKGPPAGDGTVRDQPKIQHFGQLDFKEAGVDVQEAEANLSAAQRAKELPTGDAPVADKATN